MPSAATIARDIHNGSVNEIGKYPNQGNHGILHEYSLSKEYHLRMGYGYFRCGFEGSKVHFNPVRAVHQVEGTFAEFDDALSVATVMDHHCRIAVSGFFSGCEWQIYKVKDAVFHCVHVPRSSTKPDFWTDAMAQYAPKAGWTLVAAYPSRGAVQNTGETVWFVSQLLPNRRIETVRIVVAAISGTDFSAGLRPRIARTDLYTVDVP